MAPVVAIRKQTGKSKAALPMMRGWTDDDIVNSKCTEETIKGDLRSWLSFDGDVNTGKNIDKATHAINLASATSNAGSQSIDVGTGVNNKRASAQFAEEKSSPPILQENVPAELLRQLQSVYDAKMKNMEESYKWVIVRLEFCH